MFTSPYPVIFTLCLFTCSMYHILYAQYIPLDRSAPVYIAGHNGLVGSALMRLFAREGFTNIITRSSAELDLRDAAAVEKFFATHKPTYVILAAARVGGIKANYTYPAQFIYDNLMINTNVIDASYRHRVQKLLVLGSSCIYPRECPQPIKEEYLLSGPLEKTNEGYAIAKIAGLKLVEMYNKQYNTDFISCMPTNLYGEGDNFDLVNSHVIPGLIRKFYEAKQTNAPCVTIWGTGCVYREFLHVEDCAHACLFLMEHYRGNTPVNIGMGSDVTIRELVEYIRKLTGYTGELRFDTSEPDGTPRKLLDVSMINTMGWHAKIALHEGLARTISWYQRYRSQQFS